MKKEADLLHSVQGHSQETVFHLPGTSLGQGDNRDNCKKISNNETESKFSGPTSLSLVSAICLGVAQTLWLNSCKEIGERDGGWQWRQRAWSLPAAICAGNPCASLGKCCLNDLISV